MFNEYGYSLDQIDEELSVAGSGSGDARADFLIWRTPQEKADEKTALIVGECKADNVTIDRRTYGQGANYAQYERAKRYNTPMSFLRKVEWLYYSLRVCKNHRYLFSITTPTILYSMSLLTGCPRIQSQSRSILYIVKISIIDQYIVWLLMYKAILGQPVKLHVIVFWV